MVFNPNREPHVFIGINAHLTLFNVSEYISIVKIRVILQLNVCFFPNLQSGMMIAPVIANLGSLEALSFRPNPSEVRFTSHHNLFSSL